MASHYPLIANKGRRLNSHLSIHPKDHLRPCQKLGRYHRMTVPGRGRGGVYCPIYGGTVLFGNPREGDREERGRVPALMNWTRRVSGCGGSFGHNSPQPPRPGSMMTATKNLHNHNHKTNSEWRLGSAFKGTIHSAINHWGGGEGSAQRRWSRPKQ